MRFFLVIALAIMVSGCVTPTSDDSTIDDSDDTKATGSTGDSNGIDFGAAGDGYTKKTRPIDDLFLAVQCPIEVERKLTSNGDGVRVSTIFSECEQEVFDGAKTKALADWPAANPVPNQYNGQQHVSAYAPNGALIQWVSDWGDYDATAIGAQTTRDIKGLYDLPLTQTGTYQLVVVDYGWKSSGSWSGHSNYYTEWLETNYKIKVEGTQ